MCHQCYTDDTSIQFRKQEMFKRLLEYELNNNRSTCDRCRITLWKMGDDGVIESVRMMHRDHIDIFTKVDSISVMVSKGVTWQEIHTELQNCRSLCVPCHSLVTRAEKVVGLQKLKRLRVGDAGRSNMIKKRAVERVNALIEHVTAQQHHHVHIVANRQSPSTQKKT